MQMDFVCECSRIVFWWKEQKNKSKRKKILETLLTWQKHPRFHINCAYLSFKNSKKTQVKTKKNKKKTEQIERSFWEKKQMNVNHRFAIKQKKTLL
jgi:hypothetical protein